MDVFRNSKTHLMTFIKHMTICVARSSDDVVLSREVELSTQGPNMGRVEWGFGVNLLRNEAEFEK